MIEVKSYKPTAAQHAAACVEVDAYVNELLYPAGTGAATQELVSLSCDNVGGEQPWRFTVVVRSVAR